MLSQTIESVIHVAHSVSFSQIAQPDHGIAIKRAVRVGLQFAWQWYSIGEARTTGWSGRIDERVVDR